MAKKGEILFWMFLGGMYAFAFSVSPMMNYISFLRSAAPGHTPSAENLELATKWETGYFGIVAVYFVITIIFWTISYFATWKLANRYPRLNIKLVFEPRFSKLFLGMGVTSIKEIKGSSIEVLNSLQSAGMIKVFEEIKKEIEIKFHGKRAVEKTVGDTGKGKGKDDQKNIPFTIDDLKKEDLNFETFPIELMHKKDWENFFEKDEIAFFKNIGIKDTKEFLSKNHAEIDLCRAKYFNQFKRMIDISAKQIILKKCLEYLNSEQINFLKSMNIHNIQDLLDSDLENLNAKYNDQFVNPKGSLLVNFTNIIKAPINSMKRVDFREIIKFMVNDLIAKEKNFTVDIDKEDYMKYVIVKVNRVRSMFPDKKAYLIGFDSAMDIPAATPEFDFYKQREIEDNSRVKADAGEINMDKNTVPIKKVLILTPIAWNDCHLYHPDEIDDFNGHQVDCNQITDIVCRYRGMLTSDICVIEIRSCDWSVNFSASDSIEWTTDELYNINMAAMYQLLRDTMLVQEDIKKNWETDKARVERKDKELDKMWSKKWADTTPDAATKKLLGMKPVPINPYIAVIIVVLFAVGILLGLVLGIFLSPWLGAAFGVHVANNTSSLVMILSMIT